MRKTTLLLMLACCTLVPASGQFADVSSAGGPVTISAAWRFHTGDDPQWASPAFDDSHWSLLHLDRSWAEQGYRGYSGFAWYRLKLKLPAAREPLALAMSRIADADEIYANGQLIGADGQMRPSPVRRANGASLPAIPLPPGVQGHTIELAIRVWQSPLRAKAAALPVLGAGQDVNRIRRLSLDGEILANLPFWIVDFIAALIGLFSLALFLMRPAAREYAWAACYLFCAPAMGIAEWVRTACELQPFPWNLWFNGLIAFRVVFWFLFIWGFVRARVDRIFIAGIAVALLFPASSALVALNLTTLSHFFMLGAIATITIGLLIFIKLVRLSAKGNRDAQLFLAPFLLVSLVEAIQNALRVLYEAGMDGVFYLPLYQGNGFTITWDECSLLLADFAIGAVLVHRFTRTAERDERLSAEMEAAHRVQAQLVPLQLPATPQFRFEAAYLAASEVGGDFYQAFLQPDGSVLLAIGDVSGKGLKAAMLGTLVVGALRTLAQEGLRPAQILVRLNTQLTASTDGGFVTCCVAQVCAEGRLTLANAGHLAPYCNGQELAVESGFPLGVIPGAEYAEIAVALATGDRLTFLSDGVVEARNPSGELFGFERTLAFSTQSADRIARAAQSHGQQDDITVLTLSYAPAEVAHA